MRLVLDRIEEDKAVFETENRRIIVLPLDLLEDAKEGDVYILKKDEEGTEKRSEEIKALADSLFED